MAQDHSEGLDYAVDEKTNLILAFLPDRGRERYREKESGKRRVS